jgi:uncharacterized membrane protein YqjE
MNEANSRDAPHGAAGLFRSLTNMLATLIAIVQTRVELFTTELQEELRHAASLVLWGLIALFTALIGVLVGGLTIVFAYWDTHRVLASVLVTAAFVVFAVIAMLVMMIKIRSHRRLFDATLTELTKDAAALRSRHL